MFGKWLARAPTNAAETASQSLLDVVHRELPTADYETHSVVAAMAALLGTVAYADREYSATEERRVREELQRVQGMTAEGIDAICAVLRSNILEIATTETHQHCRTLRDIADRDLRFEVLRLLMDVAASDGTITLAETTTLRQITQSLGLTQDDYTALQEQHREKLRILSGSR